MTKNILARALLAAILVFAAPPIVGGALASEKHDKGHGHGESAEIGKAGDPAKVTRTIEIVMYDNYYEPEKITLKQGETVRFVVKNAGELVHEFNIATADMHLAHAPEMMMMVDHGVLEPDRINWEAAKKMQATMGHGMHAEPNSLLLEPGKSGEIVWTFPDHAELQFACNIPGHYDAGMQGPIKLTH
jgi:uncharacterized cupredoxin-like copper-binding protein